MASSPGRRSDAATGSFRHIQPHEFEALLLADTSAFGRVNPRVAIPCSRTGHHCRCHEQPRTRQRRHQTRTHRPGIGDTYPAIERSAMA